MSKEIILTGIRSNDTPTIGNFLGAMLPMVVLQKRFAGQYQLHMFVPDLHSFTTPTNYARLYQNTIQNLTYFIAAGLDIDNPDTFLYRQSYISAHSEMTWILDCFTYYGQLRRMTQFKDKSSLSSDDSLGFRPVERTSDEADAQELLSKLKENVTVGLFNYPVLMAADILLYGARWVPVGEDQRQHLELARDLATRLNNKFGRELFVVPESWDKQLSFAQRDNGVRIRSLANPDKKMSKSVSDPRGTILLTDDPANAAGKIMGATTDSFGSIDFDFAQRPGISNLLQILALLSEKPQADVNAEWVGKSNYGELKQAVAAAVQKFLAEFQQKLAGIDEAALLTKLEQDELAIQQVANKTLLSVQQAVGLRP